MARGIWICSSHETHPSASAAPSSSIVILASVVLPAPQIRERLSVLIDSEEPPHVRSRGVRIRCPYADVSRDLRRDKPNLAEILGADRGRVSGCIALQPFSERVDNILAHGPATLTISTGIAGDNGQEGEGQKTRALSFRAS
jgi:hypothetical protein